MTTPAEARATKATEAQRQAAIKAVSELPASGGGYMALYHETLSDKIGEGSITKIVDTVLNAALSLPPPEAKATCRWPDCGCGTSPSAPNICDEAGAKEGAAQSPETGGPDLVPLDVFNEAERTHMAMVRETAAKASPETGCNAPVYPWRETDLMPTASDKLKKAAAERLSFIQWLRDTADIYRATRNAQGATALDRVASYLDLGEFLRTLSALAAVPAAPSPDLAALEAVAQRLENSASGLSLASFARQDAALVRTTILHLKAQPNAGPSADGGTGGAA